MDSKQLKQLGNALREARALTELDLSSNSLGWSGVDGLSRALCDLPTLRKLNLSYNEPGDRFKYLLQLVRTHKELRSLSMVERRKEDFGTNGKTSLALALATRHKASALSYFEIDSFSLLHDTTSLQWTAEVGQNEAIADANASVLAGVLRTNTTLQSLSLAAESKMSDTAQSVVGRALLNNPSSHP